MSEMRHGNSKVISGYLYKEGKRLKGKTRRYLTLQGTKFSHHMKEGQPSTWEVNINDVQVSIGERPLEFVISAGGRSLSFFTESSEDLEMWLNGLKSANSNLEDFYEIGKVIGKGSYGEVFLATDKVTKEQCAVKIIRKNPSNRKQKKFIERERAIMTTVDHPNIVKTFDVFEGPNKLAIVSEYMGGGELFDLIIASQYFTEEKARLIMQQILKGVQYLHQNNIVHRDIKPENVLCAGDQWPLEVKLTDFGLSNFVEDDAVDASSALLSHVGTSFYLAPEVVGREGYAFPVDLWACGVVLYIMLCGRFPFWGKTDIEYMKRLSHGPSMVGDGWSEVSNAGKGFLKQLLQLDPKRRLTADQALDHPWIRGAEGPEEGKMQKKLSSVNELAMLMSKHKSIKQSEQTTPQADRAEGERDGTPREEKATGDDADGMSMASRDGKHAGKEDTSPEEEVDENVNINISS